MTAYSRILGEMYCKKWHDGVIYFFFMIESHITWFFVRGCDCIGLDLYYFQLWISITIQIYSKRLQRVEVMRYMTEATNKTNLLEVYMSMYQVHFAYTREAIIIYTNYTDKYKWVSMIFCSQHIKTYPNEWVSATFTIMHVKIQFPINI